jgi:uncharacterized protein involved in outer membrane biogenesis
MKTLIKVLLAIAAVVVVLLVAVAVWVALIFEPNDIRPMLVNAVERNTGRSFEIEGDLGLSLFPCCSVTVGPSRLGNPSGFPDGHFARLSDADLSLRIWPLLTRREVQIGTVTVDGLDLSLLRLADGRANWEFDERADERPEAEPASPLDGLSIAGLRISDARVDFRDLQAEQAYAVSELQLRTGAIVADAPFPFEASATVTDEDDGTQAQLQAAGTLSLADARVLVRNPRLDIIASGPAVPARRAEVRVQGGAVEIVFAEATVLTTDALSMRFELTALDELAADLRGRANLDGLHMNLDTMSGRVSAMTFEAQGLDARARGTASGAFGVNAGSSAELRGTFDLERAAPRTLLAALGDIGYRPARADALNRLSGGAQWSLVGERVRVDDLNIVLDDSRLTGTATLDEYGAGAVRFDLVLDQLDVDRYAPAAAPGSAARVQPTIVPLAELSGFEFDGKVRVGRLLASGLSLSDVAVTATSDRGTATVSLQGQVANGRFELAGSGNVAAADPHMSGQMTLQNVSPRALLTALGTPPQTSDANALSVLSGNADWRLGTRDVGLQNIAWQLDDTRVTGSMRIDDLDRITTRFDLALDRMNVDRYLAPEQADAPAEAPTAIPVELIRELDVTGRVTARELTLFDVPLQNVEVQARGSDGVLRLDPLRASLYGGDYRGVMTIDATGQEAAITVDQQVSAVQIGELLRAFYDTDRINGSLSMNLSGSGTGATVTDLIQGLAAEFSLNLNDGVYRGVDLLQEIRQARAALRSERLPSAPEDKNTPLRALSLSGRMIDGVLTSETLRAETDALRLSGRGGFNVVDYTLDYRLNAEVLRDVAGLSDLAGITLPLTIAGPLTAPSVSVDLAGAATSALRERAEDRARDALLRALGGDRDAKPPPEDTPPAPTEGDPAPAEQQAEQEPAAEPQPSTRDESPRDLLRRGLRDLIKPAE